MPSAKIRALALALSCSSLALPACNGDVEVAIDSTLETPPPPVVTATPPKGALLWSRVYGGQFDDAAGPLVLLPDGQSRFIGKGLLDGSTDPGEVRGLLMEVDGKGDLAAHQRLGTSSLYPVGVGQEAVGLNGQRVIAGRFSHGTSLAGCALQGPTGYGGEFVAALDEQGACLWATTFAASVGFSSIDVGATGEILVAGEGKPGASLGAGVTLPTPTDAGGGSRFHARFSATGAPLSAHEVDGFAMPLARFDHDGGIVVAGQNSLARVDAKGTTSWSVQMPESVYIGSLVVAGPSVVVELRDDAGAALRSFHVSDGTEAWKVAIAGSESTELGALSIAASDGGAVVVAAHLAGGKTVSLGTEALTGKGVNNLLWALFDGDGGVVRSQIVPVDGTIYPSAVATDAGGDVWVLGSFSGSVDFGDGLHTAHPSPPPTTALDPFGYDVFLARYH
jgi:outer membrane protein assembly factor BamB